MRRRLVYGISLRAASHNHVTVAQKYNTVSSSSHFEFFLLLHHELSMKVKTLFNNLST